MLCFSLLSTAAPADGSLGLRAAALVLKGLATLQLLYAVSAVCHLPPCQGCVLPLFLVGRRVTFNTCCSVKILPRLGQAKADPCQVEPHKHTTALALIYVHQLFSAWARALGRLHLCSWVSKTCAIDNIMHPCTSEILWRAPT